ncbi:zinc finger CCCH-type containing 7Ba isoform X3 [Pimephales promelas]|uniref:zinc finger CCCH-type containing 7Ba isoform X3 n=1 Tax=Pimephales promelas TaxID=90988 RepID=UPI0019557276|nr:zinc finger CCCH-type containing 7Ba isoform X3 [Pimephales promelas]XP_039543479.1 zinc finger CCCH-type containing 7Ba isoform X3 [Pimephales promelas]KAG1966940.1 zinc finger CCCH domain-containing protein 7A [Pimephales promelas]
MSAERQKRREEIRRALSFIKCSLPYPDPAGYEGFVVQLVCDLLDEGNASFREGEWTQARAHFSEGVNVSLYAQAEGLHVPNALLESLYINRAATHQNMGEFDSGVRDCDRALEVCKDRAKALYRKAVCLKESGRLREAYDCSAACLLASPQDQTVSNLSQEIAVSLGLRNRKAYISSQRGKASGSEDNRLISPPLDEISSVEPERVADSAAGLSPVLPAPVPVSDSHEALGLSVPVSQPLEDNDLMGDELDSLLDCMSKEEDTPQTGVVSPGRVCFPSPSPRLPPAFFSSVGSQLNSLDSFIKPETNSCSTLDALDSIFPSTDVVLPQRPLVVGGDVLDSLSEFTLPGGKVGRSFLPSVKLTNSSHERNGHVTSTRSCLSKNPLEQTHEFAQACSSCFTSTGPGVLDFELRSEVNHSCQKDLLLCRRRGGANSPWRRIRPRPTRNNFHAAFALCREVLESQVCKYGEGCTFAYCQEEIDVWTQERRGLLVRELLFNPLATNERQALSVTTLLNTHTGMFMFLCEACFDFKPRMISRRWKEDPDVCANLQTQHQFDKKKCLVHVVKSSAVSYSKIRELSPRCQFDMCRHELSVGCKMEDGCCFAHSIIELQIWILQRDSGISHEEIVQESKKHWNKQRPVFVASRSPNKIAAAKSKSPIRAEQTNGVVQGTGSADAAEVKGHELELMLMFVCGQCWKDGLVSEPDRAMKYCTAKARHSWSKDRRVLLVKSHKRKKWVSVRPVPYAKTFPQQYDICIHVLQQRKCHYIGNCSFAHSQEEKELWTYMKNKGFTDVQQVFDVWLSNQNRASDCASPPQPIEEKQITMPTDFAELMQDSFYCPLCGKHSNSDRQWQQHISSEKHKLRVFSGEGEDESLTWSYRFPGPCFSICPRFDDGCTDGMSCDFAHSEEELQEWLKRRDFLRLTLEKARADMLISPNDNDFGIYNFLLQK